MFTQEAFHLRQEASFLSLIFSRWSAKACFVTEKAFHATEKASSVKQRLGFMIQKEDSVT
jgi:hypothetical protein